MPRIKILSVPKSAKGLHKFDVGGLNDCPEGQVWDESMQTCVQDTGYQEVQKNGFITGTTNNQGEKVGGVGAVETDTHHSEGYNQPAKTDDNNNSINNTTTNNTTNTADNTNNNLNLNKLNTFGKVIKGMSKFTNPINKAIHNPLFMLGSGMINYGLNRKEQSDNNKWLKNSMFSRPVDSTTDKGDYDQSGVFRPNQKVVNPGMYNDKFYGMVRYGGQPHFDVGGGFESVLPSTVVPTYSVDTPIITPRATVSSPVPTEANVSTKSSKSSSVSSGANPMALQTWKDYSSEFKDISNLGIWGDEAHKKRKSDHNTGDALDIGINDLNTGSQIAQKLINESDKRNVKYIIFNNQIWNPSISNEWRPYNGQDPHTGHVHVSFNRGESSDTESNNPLNLHYGSFAEKYNAIPGKNDSDGKVAIFPSLQVGLEANKELLFGPKYNTLTISQARNKWVSGSPDVYNPSTKNIVQEMGADKRLSDLTAEEKDKLFKLFAKWEDKKSYDAIKNLNIFGNKPTFELGGQNNKNMKIRIVGTPDENQMAYGGQPPYSGQTDYGLYIGQRNLYRTMAKNPYKDAGNTVKEEKNSDSPYVLEAEGGETIVRPDGTHMNIEGPRHTNGGVKLNKEQAPEGSFIFSDTKKMRIGGAILQSFGKGKNDKNKYTPADLAKQYPVNKYRAILEDPNADELSKKTARIMVKNLEKKLAELALLQEGMKGFPQGIPKISEKLVQENSENESMPTAAYGGMYAFGGSLERFDTGGEPDPKKIADLEKQGYTRISGTNKWRKGTKTVEVKNPTIIKGTAAQEAVIKKGTPGQKYVPNENAWWRSLTPAQKAAHNAKVHEMLKTDPKYTGTPDEVITPAVAATPDKKTCDPGYKLNETTGLCEKIKEGEDIVEIPEEKPDSAPVPGDASQTVVNKPFNAGRPPFFSYGMFITPEMEKVFAASKHNEIPRPVFYDPAAELAQNAGLANTVTSNFPGTAQGYSANAIASQMAAAQNAANILGRYNNLNVGVGNEYNKLQAALMNEEQAYNADRADKLFYNTQQAKKAYRNNWAKWLNNLGQIDKNNYALSTGANMLNAMHPYFNTSFGPNGMVITPKPGTDWYSMVTGRAASMNQQGSAQSAQQYLKTINDLKGQYPNASPAQINRAYQMMYPGATSSATSGAGKTAAAYATQAMNMLPYSANNGMYNQGYDISDLYDQDQ